MSGVVDHDALETTSSGTRLARATAVIIGTIALLAALLGLIEVNASQQASRSELLAARLSTAIAERLSTSSFLFTFGNIAAQDALAIGIGGTTRVLDALQAGDTSGVAEALGSADAAASERLAAIAAEMSAVPGAGGPLDAHTAQVLAVDLASIEAMATDQRRLVDDSALWNARSSRAVLGLTLLALAGVLIGLAAVFGEGRPGRTALIMAGSATGLAALAGAAALI